MRLLKTYARNSPSTLGVQDARPQFWHVNNRNPQKHLWMTHTFRAAAYCPMVSNSFDPTFHWSALQWRFNGFYAVDVHMYLNVCVCVNGLSCARTLKRLSKLSSWKGAYGVAFFCVGRIS